jgi:hypothetical protein
VIVFPNTDWGVRHSRPLDQLLKIDTRFPKTVWAMNSLQCVGAKLWRLCWRSRGNIICRILSRSLANNLFGLPLTVLSESFREKQQWSVGLKIGLSLEVVKDFCGFFPSQICFIPHDPIPEDFLPESMLLCETSILCAAIESFQDGHKIDCLASLLQPCLLGRLWLSRESHFIPCLQSLTWE